MMLPSFVTKLAVASTLLPLATANNCSVDPLVLPIRNVTFPNGIGANRGIKLVLGEQTQGLRISTIFNNTRVRNILDCPSNDTIDLIGCQGASGSIYSTTSGSFSQVQNEEDWDVIVTDPSPDDGSTTVLRGYDTANFTDGAAVIQNYPIEVWANQDSDNLSALALGPASSTLDKLVDDYLAPSSVFGLDYGSTSEYYPRDGQIIFGGINEGRYNKTNRTEFSMWEAGTSANCPLQVLVSDIVLNNDDGEHSLLPQDGGKFAACIDTLQNSFILSDEMFAKFQKIGNHIDFDGSDYDARVFPADRDSLLGTLSIRLANGYDTVIPHYELINHERGTNSQGKYAVLNSSRIAAAVTAGDTDLGANVTVLGGVFLSQNYLQVDFQKQKFWLSPQVGNGTYDDKITTACTQDKSTAASGSGSSEGVGLAVKVGVPVSVAAVIALGILAFFFYQRSRKQNAASNSQVVNEPNEHEMAAGKFPHSPNSAISSLTHRPSELESYPRSPNSVFTPIQRYPSELEAKDYYSPVELDSKEVR